MPEAEVKYTPQVAGRRGRRHSSLEIYAWLFMRISGAFLLLMAVFHLMYMHFLVPGGVAAVDYATIAARWTDPTWGVFWRTFDLLLLIFGVTHGTNGLRYSLDDYVLQAGWRTAAKLSLYLSAVILVAAGAMIVFNF